MIYHLANTSAQTESLRHGLEQTAGDTGLHVNAAISTLSGKPQKLVDKFIYLSRNISSTKSDVDFAEQRLRLLSIGYWSLIYPIK